MRVRCSEQRAPHMFRHIPRMSQAATEAGVRCSQLFCERRASTAPEQASGSPGSRFTLLAFLGLLIACATSVPAYGQLERTVPKSDYYRALTPYLVGDYNTAARRFVSTSRLRSTQGVWADSIAHYTMLGECMIRMGNPEGALKQYTLAVQVFLQNPGWMNAIEFSPALEPSRRTVRYPPTWGSGTRTVRIARIRDPMPSLQGNSEAANLEVLKRGGGVLSRQQYLMVHVHEIVRCTALAIARRGDIMGPACGFDRLTSQLITALERRPAPPAPLAQAWVSAQLGFAYASAGKMKEAAAELNKSLLAGGMDHTLTPMALLGLGKLAFQAKQYQTAEKYCRDATFSAALLSQDDSTQYDTISEAFRWGMVAHRATGNREPYGPLAAAAAWTHRIGSRGLGPRGIEATIMLTAAEDLAARGNANTATSWLDQAARVLRPREMLAGTAGARHQFISAHVHFLNRNMARGKTALAKAMTFQRKSSGWLFQILLADRLTASGAITTRESGLLYSAVLRDPTAQDWTFDPMESLTTLVTLNRSAYDHWLLLVLERKEQNKALQIIDQLRRRRFYGSLPLGGRVLNLRWIVEAPPEALPTSIVLQRKGLLTHYPALAQLSQQAQQLQAELKKLPAVPKDDDFAKQQALLKQLADVSVAAEAVLSAVALGPEPSDPVFPPRMSVEEVQQQLKPGQQIMVFASTSNGTFAFLIGSEAYSSWRIEPLAKVRARVSTLLHEIGLYDRNQPITDKELSDESWKTTAAELLKQLTGDAPASAWDKIEELIIVPDGPLWYVPFETLIVDNGQSKVPLIDKVRIRYAPTMSLAVPDHRPRARIARTAVVASRLFPKNDDSAARNALQAMQSDDAGVFAVPVKPVPSSFVYIAALDRLIVLSDLANDAGPPYRWAPLDLDRGKATGTLAQWMALPWKGPDQIILPGFHTPAENGLKRGGNGDDMFLAACGLMATGCRTVLLSRWRDGGQTTYELIREFVRELPHRPASAAWQRAVHLAKSSDLDLPQEPRVNASNNDTSLKAESPFFWAGYALIDTGAEPK